MFVVFRRRELVIAVGTYRIGLVDDRQTRGTFLGRHHPAGARRANFNLDRIDQAMSKLEVGQRRSRVVNLDDFRKALARDIAAMLQ